MEKVFKGIPIKKGHRRTAFGLNRLLWLLQKSHFIVITNGRVYASLKTELLFYTVSLILAFSIIMGSFFYVISKKELERNFEKWTNSFTENLSYDLQYVLLSNDKVKLDNYLIGAMSDSRILFAVVMDQFSSTVAVQDPGGLFKPEIYEKASIEKDYTFEKYTSESGQTFFGVVQPIKFHEAIDWEQYNISDFEKNASISAIKKFDKLGTLVLGISTASITLQINEWLHQAALIILLIGLVFVTIVFMFVEKMVSPIKKLVAATVDISKGDLDFRIQNERKDELGILTNSFNEMVAKLFTTQKEIQKYTKNLEKIVEERTRKLQYSEKKYKTLFDHSGTALALFDDKGQILMINQQFESLCGYSGDQVVEKKTFFSFLTNDDQKDFQKHLQKINENAVNNEPVNFECVFNDKDKNGRRVNITLSNMPETNSVLSSILDVTEIRELERKLGQTKHLAEIGELSAAIAHELRNPLSAIHASVDILYSSLMVENEDAQLMAIIRKESKRLDRIISDFLKFARLRNSSFKRCDIRDVVNAYATRFENRYSDTHKLDIYIAENVPLLNIDQDQIMQVLENVCDNAREAQPDGGTIILQLEKGSDIHQNEYVKIMVSDKGHGIEEAKLKTIFRPFVSSKSEQVGMGLSICERIISNHNGTMDVKSAPGKGTTVIIKLPI